MRGTRRTGIGAWKAAVPVIALLLAALSTGVFATGAWTEHTVQTVRGPVHVKVAGSGPYRISLGNAAFLPAVDSFNLGTSLAPVAADGSPLSLAKGDFDEDGRADVAAGYTSRAGGFLTLSLAGSNYSGYFSAPQFIPGAVAALAENPDFLLAGDFNRDGHTDLLTAARGGARLNLFAGNGRGGLGEPSAIALPGAVTALTTGSFGQAGRTDVIAAVRGKVGSSLLVYSDLKGEPLSLGLPAEATDLAIGPVLSETSLDVVVAAGNRLFAIGRDGSSLTGVERVLPEPVLSVTVGGFTGPGRREVAVLTASGDVLILSAGIGKPAPRLPEWECRKVTRRPIAGASFLESAKISTAPGLDLLLDDPSSKTLRVLLGGNGGQENGLGKPYASEFLEDLSVPFRGGPSAVLPMRLGASAIQGLVVATPEDKAVRLIPSAPTATFTVTNTNDFGAGSLRRAINDSNDSPGLNLIQFNVGTGSVVFAPTVLSYSWPAITVPVILDGTTQPGYSGYPIVEIDASQLPADALTISAGGSTIRSLIINGSPEAAVKLTTAGNNVVEACWLGTDSMGTTAVPNFRGIELDFIPGNLVGGTTYASRNIITGNSDVGIVVNGGIGNAILGNYIGAFDGGFDASGSFYGVLLYGASNTMVGGSSAGMGNLISGNFAGIVMQGGNGNAVQGNRIGSDATGAGPLGNVYGVVLIELETLATIGGASPGMANLISGNDGPGVVFYGSSSNAVAGNLIGVALDGTTALGNGDSGVLIGDGLDANNNLIGGPSASEANVIAHNGAYGIHVAMGSGNGLFGNAIFANTSGGIRREAGANNNQAAPVLSGAYDCGGSWQVLGTLAGAPNTPYTVEFFSNTACPGQARTFLDRRTVTTDASGAAVIALDFASAPPANVRATATDSANNTSAISNCLTLEAGPDLSAAFSAPSPAVPLTGQTVTYVITVQNASATVAANNAVLTVTLPAGAAGYAFGGSTGAPTVTGPNPLVVTWPSIPAATSYVFQYSVNFPAPGFYDTSAAVVADECDPLALNNGSSDTIAVYDPLTAAWSASTTAASIGEVVTFTAAATGGDGNYTYTFYPADGTGPTTATDPIYTHVYAAAGTFSTYVRVVDGLGNTVNSAHVPVTVTAPVTVALATVPAAPVGGAVPLSVAFTATAAGGDGAYSYAWDFGDGTTGAGDAITHIYTTVGSFTAWVVVTDGAGRLASASVAVTTQPQFSVALAATPLAAFTGQTVTFIPLVQGGLPPYTYTYDYGDGNTGASQTYIYTTSSMPGTFPATVTVTDSASPANTLTSAAVEVTIWETLAVIASAASPTSGTVPLTVDFTATATGGDGSYTYRWHMGDGTVVVDTATPSIPSHVYGVAGTYTVLVEVADGSGHSVTSAPIPVEALGVMSATLTATPISGFAPLGVSFLPGATGGDGLYTYDFDYGDGTTGPGLVHTYASGGIYLVVMTASDGSGNSAITNVVLTVWDPIAVSLAATSATSGLIPLTVDFQADASGGDVSSDYTWTWSWGDGTSATTVGASPATLSHAYSAPGSFNVTVTVRDASGNQLTSNVVPVVAQAGLGAGFTAYPTHGFRNLDVNFTAVAQGGAGGYTYELDPGDGSGTLVNGSGLFLHTYSTAGVFSASVTVTDSAANTQTSTPVAVTVWDPLSVSASAGPATTGAVPLTVDFTATATGGDSSTYTYEWDFGNGNTATGATPSFTYNIPGDYTVTVTVTDGWGNKATSTPILIVAQGVLSVSLSATPMSGTIPLDVVFTGLAQGGVPPYTYTYHYDGVNSDALGRFTYSTAGTFNAYLHVEDSAGNSADSAVIPIQVWMPLAVTANAVPTVGIVPFNVDFTAAAVGGDGSYTYAWSFGDGSSATGATPSHMYNVAGTYTATVTVTDGHGQAATSLPILIYAYDGMSVTLSATPTHGTAPLGVVFAAIPQGGDGNYTFTFDYGDGQTGSAFNHIYDTPGAYTVTVTVEDTSGHTATSNPVVINVYGPLAITAVATSPVTGTTPLAVDFVATATGGDGNYTFRWDFGDGHTAFGAAASHTYNSAGVFSVTATVTDGQNQSATSNVILITVYGPMSITFSATPVQGMIPLDVTFAAQASGGDGIYTYTLNYGDGSTGSSFNHTYTDAGTYTAMVTATDNSGHSAMASVIIHAWGPLTINAMATTPTSGTDPLLVNFSATAAGGDGVYTFRWDFGDGNTAVGPTATHIFNAAGTYTVTATVTDGHNQSVTSNRILITVYLRLRVAFSATPTQGTTPLAVTFEVSAEGGDGDYSTVINYGDGSTGTSLNHTYTAPGTYQAWARVTDGTGQVATSGSVTIRVWEPLQVIAVPTGPVSGTVPLSTSFQCTVLGGDGSYTYRWSFDGILDPSQNGTTAAHTFTAAGTHYAVVHVIDGHNNQGASDPIQITCLAPISVILSAYPSTGVTPLTVNFVPSIQGGTPPYTYLITYGDGSNGADTTHVYGAAGTFPASVTVTDANGDTGVSNTVPIIVWTPLSVTSQATSPTEGGIPLTVSFTATAMGGDGNYRYVWYFGDGGVQSDTATPSTPSHTYENSGTYYARVTVMDGHNHAVTGADILVRIHRPMTAMVYANPVKIVVDNSVTFSAQASGGSGVYEFAWDFGDGSTGLGQTVTHTFTTVGNHAVTMTATDGAGGSASASVVIQVLPVPPQIVAVKKLTSPFRLKLFGSNFHTNVIATINGTPVTTVLKSSSKILLKDIESLVPRGVPVTIVVTNLDDGGVSNSFIYVRTPVR